VGSTFLKVLTQYAQKLQAQESKLVLTGVESHVMVQMERTAVLAFIGRGNVFAVTERIGESLLQGVEAGEAWLAAQAKAS
jgi:sulfate permease, SulP family